MTETRLLFLDPATDIMEGIIELHNYIMFFLVFIVIFVFWQIFSTVGIFAKFDFLFKKNELFTIFWRDLNFRNVSLSHIKNNNYKFLELFKVVSKKSGKDYLKIRGDYNNYKQANSLVYPFTLEGKTKFLKVHSVDIDESAVGTSLWYQSIWLRFVKDLMLKTRNVTHGTAIEIVWTITPSIILILIAIPSFALLFTMDEILEPLITLKVVGHQWYWSYEYSDYGVNEQTGETKTLNFDSYMVPENELKLGDLRLLEVDNPVILPIKTPVRVLVTAADVLHSWAVPSLGIKMDAVPGRLNQVMFTIKREGVYYGQCSEICGVNHGFMPIVVKAVSLNTYTNWIEKFTSN